MAGQWISDGSPELSFEGNLAKCQVEKSSGNVYNALWKEGEGASSGSHYWKISFDGLSDSVFAGVTDLEKLKKGWATKGLLYGGNLSNGGALLVGEFGPRIKSGSVLGILAVLENNTLKVYFDLNDSPLGLAFDVPQNVLNSVFPVVHFSGTGSASIEKVSEIPKSLVRPQPSVEGITGDWKMVDNEFKINSAVQAGAEKVTLRLKREKDAGTEAYSAHLHVVNNIGFRLERKGEGQAWTTPDNRMSTLMGSSPEMMKLESNINQLTSNPTVVELEGEALVIKNSGAGMESKWVRYSTEKGPVTTNPFQ